MRLPRKRTFTSLSLAAATLALTIGCAGGGDDSDVATNRSTTTEAPAATDPVGRDGSTGTGTGSDGPEPAPGAPSSAPDPVALAAGPDLAASGPSGVGCDPGAGATLPDGWWAGTVTAVDGQSFEWDVVCWFDEAAALPAATEDGIPAEALTHPRYIRNTDPATYRLTFPSRTAPATLADATGMNAAKGTFTGTIGDVIDLYTPGRADMSRLPTANGTAQYLDEFWVHVTGGVPDYVYMQFSC
jgi:hypothetical protein